MVHKCIKPGCGKEYESDEIDPYYCPACLAEKESIAKEIDEKFANRPKKDIQSFNDKVSGWKEINGIPFINL